MLSTNRRQFLGGAASLAVVAPWAKVGLAQETQGVHSILNDLIRQYAAAASSMTNPSVRDLYEQDGFQDYLEAYPVGDLVDGFVWEPGMGAEFEGPYSNLPIKAPFTDYIPLDEGPVLDPDRTYRIGFVFHGFNHPWLISLADTVAWEAARHPNIELEVIDAEFDDSRMGQVIDTWITRQFDGIVLWPAREAPMGPPVDRAIEAGIPVVSLDRRTSSSAISSEVLGNFYANGLQQGLYLKHVVSEGNMVLNRKDLGSTADSIRTGAFLQAIGNTDGFEIVGNYHTNSQRSLAFDATADALQANSQFDISFNTGGEEALGALGAIEEAGRLNSGSSGKIIILANDDAKEIMANIRSGAIDMVAPYTPLIGDVGLRALIRHIGANEGRNEAPPRLIITPNLPMVTRTNMTIEGVQTLTPDEWLYAYGPAVE
ncbi:sugar ABC transporter substrate-binding protein [Nioella sp. MMSF_3534]|uniref:sugar ABC transporter substrate-binding protein n=2 Tax=unclassified Nioella TaxID=2635031 RepID=UPI00273F1056|nr:sugar ABC transporter substrate-binding protein [Nioella sp. MMSF_3534]